MIWLTWHPSLVGDTNLTLPKEKYIDDKINLTTSPLSLVVDTNLTLPKEKYIDDMIDLTPSLEELLDQIPLLPLYTVIG